jgi:hypothetical protein
MVIYDGEVGPFVQRVTQGLLYTLWDLGLTIGHSVRSLPDCVAMARTDFASRTSMQEARYVIGDRRLFQRFRRVLAENVYRKDFGQFLETALTEQDQRTEFGSPCGRANVRIRGACGISHRPRQVRRAHAARSPRSGSSQGQDGRRTRP